MRYDLVHCPSHDPGRIKCLGCDHAPAHERDVSCNYIDIDKKCTPCKPVKKLDSYGNEHYCKKNR